MKKFIIFLISFIILISSFVFSANAAFTTAVEIESPIAYLVSLDDDGTVIYDKNSTLKAEPASLTKIVTAILVIENCTDYEAVVTAPSYAIRLLDGTNSSTAGILVGEQLTVRQLLYCLLVYSANDAANVLADYIGGGSIDTFIGMMNDFAQKLGCTDTHFANAHGLFDENHYSTAKDLAVMYRYCLENSFFSELAGTSYYKIEPTNKYAQTRHLNSTNKMFSSGIADYYYKYLKNGKTGTNNSWNRCFISSASKDGYSYLCVILDAPMYDVDKDGVDENMSFMDTKTLYSWTFDHIRLRTVANTSTYVTEVSVKLSNEYDYVSLVPANEVNALVPTGVDESGVYVEALTELTASSVNAPVKKGDVLGKAVIKYADDVIAEVDLVAAFDVSLSSVKYIGNLMLTLMKSTAFKIALAFVVLVILPACILLFVIIPSKRRKKKSQIRIVNVNDIENRRKNIKK